jgi:hypothetical protein
MENCPKRFHIGLFVEFDLLEWEELEFDSQFLCLSAAGAWMVIWLETFSE